MSYTVEISHPAYRGVMMELYNGCYFIGAIVSTCKLNLLPLTMNVPLPDMYRARVWYRE